MLWIVAGIFLLVYYFFKDIINFFRLVYKEDTAKKNEISIEDEDY